MGKIKLNLVSGAVVEKPLINAFKANGIGYVVLDNEMNGSMGLPIILVCKLENDKLTKIVDQNEWQIVKEYLKNIIAGNKIEFINVSKEMSADDIYYTQLTLPVPSFEALKNVYEEPVGNETGSTDSGMASILDINPSSPLNNINTEVAENNNVNLVNTPVAPQIDIPTMNREVTNPEPIINNVVSESANPSNPVIDLQPQMPSMENMNGNSVGVVSSSPVDQVQTNIVVEPQTPVVNTPIVDNQINPFKEQKEAFMQACENMFDALVQKFEKELENRK